MATKELSLEHLLQRKGELMIETEENDEALSKALAKGGKGRIYIINGLPYRAGSRLGGPLYLRCQVPEEAQAMMRGKPKPAPAKKVKPKKA